MLSHFVGHDGTRFAAQHEPRRVVELVLEYVPATLLEPLADVEIDRTLQVGNVADALELILLTWSESNDAIDPCIFRWLAVAAKGVGRPDLVRECDLSSTRSMKRNGGRPLVFFSVERVRDGQRTTLFHPCRNELTNRIRRFEDRISALPDGLHPAAEALYWVRSPTIWEAPLVSADNFMEIYLSASVQVEKETRTLSQEEMLSLQAAIVDWAKGRPKLKLDFR